MSYDAQRDSMASFYAAIEAKKKRGDTNGWRHAGGESFLAGRVVLHCGDCLNVLAGLPANSIDAVVTDPPYHLTSIVKRFGGNNAKPTRNGDVYLRASTGFMGKMWDGGDIAFRIETWAALLRVLKPGGHVVAFSGTRTYHRMAVAIEDAGFEIRDQLAWTYGSGFPKSHNIGNGWGTALKPAWEPICLARKPLIGTVAENVLAHGTGAINVDACRIGDEEMAVTAGNGVLLSENTSMSGGNYGRVSAGIKVGRWPANLVHDGSDEVLAAFSDVPDQAVARFFYTAKADQRTRLGARHPTVKPLDLMQWLCRLVTPKGGVVLDLFAGTGTTGEAAWREGFSAVLIEKEEDSQADIRMRLKLATEYAKREAVAKTKRRLQGAEGTPLFPWSAEGRLL